MRTYTATAAAFAAMTILALAADTRAQQGPFVWGIVKWEQTGSPAVGLEVRLVQGDQVRARTYTNQRGQYGFFGAPGEPSQYRLQVVSAGTILNESGLEGTSVGGRARDIVVR